VYHVNSGVEGIEVEVCVIINGLLRGIRGEIVTVWGLDSGTNILLIVIIRSRNCNFTVCC
jgi:hypothetical protein